MFSIFQDILLLGMNEPRGYNNYERIGIKGKYDTYFAVRWEVIHFRMTSHVRSSPVKLCFKIGFSFPKQPKAVNLDNFWFIC